MQTNLGDPPTALANLDAIIDAAEAEAAHGCGLSDVLYEARVQAAYEAILEKAPASTTGGLPSARRCVLQSLISS